MYESKRINREVYLDDSFSVNLIEVESVYQDNGANIVVITADMLSENQVEQIKIL